MAERKPQNFGEVLANAGSAGLNFMAANYLPQQQQQKADAMGALMMMMRAQDAERDKQMHSLLMVKGQKDIQNANLRMSGLTKELARDPVQDKLDVYKGKLDLDARQPQPSNFPDLSKMPEMIGAANELNTAGFGGEFYPTLSGNKWGVNYAKPPVSNASIMNDLPEHATVRVQELSRRRSLIQNRYTNKLTGKVDLPPDAENEIQLINVENDLITKAITPAQVRATFNDADFGDVDEKYLEKYRAKLEAILANYENK